jgi:hypothetical protein
MTIHHRILLPLLLISAMITGCDSGTIWKSGPYEVFWIDRPRELELGLRVDSSGILGLVPACVIAIGDNETWIVAATHPDGDTSKTAYWYLPKSDDHLDKSADEIVKGPLTLEQFQNQTTELNLPPLSKRF